MFLASNPWWICCRHWYLSWTFTIKRAVVFNPWHLSEHRPGIATRKMTPGILPWWTSIHPGRALIQAWASMRTYRRASQLFIQTYTIFLWAPENSSEASAIRNNFNSHYLNLSSHSLPQKMPLNDPPGHPKFGTFFWPNLSLDILIEFFLEECMSERR